MLYCKFKDLNQAHFQIKLLLHEYIKVFDTDFKFDRINSILYLQNKMSSRQT